MRNPEEPVVDHVDGDTRLLEGHVADQRLVAPVLGFHLHEEELADDRVETRDADHDRPADLAAHDAMVGGLELDRARNRKGPETVPPRPRERQAVRAGIDQRIEAKLVLRLAEVADRDRRDDTTHPCLPGREPETETARHGRTMQYLESGIKRPHAAQRNAGSTRSANSRAGSRVSRPKNSITKSVQPRAVWRRMRSITCAGVPQMPCASRPAPMCPP